MPEDRRRSRLVWIIVGLLIAGMVGAGWAWRVRSAHYNEQVRLAEATAAREADLIVANQTQAERIEGLVEQSDLLRAEVERIRAVVPEAEVRTVTRWRTREVEVPVERIVELPGPEVRVEVPADCPAPEPPEALRFTASGEIAQVYTEAGNLLAAGTMRLTRTHPPPPEVIFEEPWAAETTIETTELPEAEQRRRKWGLWLGLDVDNPEWIFVNRLERFEQVTERTVWSGGVARRWKWGELRAGATDELAASVGMTFYPRRK